MGKKKHKTLAGYFGGFFEAGKKAHAPPRKHRERRARNRR